MDLAGGDHRDVLDEAVVVYLVMRRAARADPGERGARRIAFENDRIFDRGALAPEVDDRVAVGLALVEDEDVLSGAAAQHVRAGAAVQDVVAVAARDVVIAAVAVEHVVAGAAENRVLSAAAAKRIGAARAVQS